MLPLALRIDCCLGLSLATWSVLYQDSFLGMYLRSTDNDDADTDDDDKNDLKVALNLLCAMQGLVLASLAMILLGLSFVHERTTTNQRRREHVSSSSLCVHQALAAAIFGAYLAGLAMLDISYIGYGGRHLRKERVLLAHSVVCLVAAAFNSAALVRAFIAHKNRPDRDPSSPLPVSRARRRRAGAQERMQKQRLDAQKSAARKGERRDVRAACSRAGELLKKGGEEATSLVVTAGTNPLVEPLLLHSAEARDNSTLLANNRCHDSEPVVLDGNVAAAMREEEAAEAAAATTTPTTTTTTTKPKPTGWRDLLALAGPQKRWIFLASLVLFLRLPFSLAVPHFVSMTLGAIIDGDGGSARRCVLWLLCCGTIDALLDFWTFFLFGYAQQALVRGL